MHLLIVRTNCWMNMNMFISGYKWCTRCNICALCCLLSCPGYQWRPVVSTQPAVNALAQEIPTVAGVCFTTCKCCCSTYNICPCDSKQLKKRELFCFLAASPTVNRQFGVCAASGFQVSSVSLTPGPVPSPLSRAVFQYSGAPKHKSGHVSGCCPGTRPCARTPFRSITRPN